MPWYQERQEWRVQIGNTMLSPDQPGPPGENWQLAGTWALTFGPLGECRYAELGLTNDPGLRLDSTLVRIWEHPDTTQPPDFRGVVGVVRGNKDAQGGKYTLAIVGEGDLDEPGLARYATYTRVGAGYGLTPNPEETTGAFHARILEAFGDGGWGVKGDGTRVVGVPTGGVRITAGDVQGLTSSGYQRREYVTETSASPGDRWKRLYDVRALPQPYAPRVYAPASSDDLILPNIERVATTVTFKQATSGVSFNDEAYGSVIVGSGTVTFVSEVGELDVRPSQDASPEESMFAPLKLRVRSACKLSDLVRGSQRSKLAADATYSLTGLRYNIEFSGVSVQRGIDPQDRAQYTIIRQDKRRAPELTFRVYLGRSENALWDDALSQEFTGSFTPPLKPFPPNTIFFAYANMWQDNFGTGKLIVPVDIPDDLIAEVYQSLNSGNYWLILEAELVVPTAITLWEKVTQTTADGVTTTHRNYIVQNGNKYGLLSIKAPTMTRDELVSSIPAANYPDGWDAGSVGPATTQGRVTGGLIPPALANWNNQQVTEARLVREYGAYYTEIQTGARQTQKLLKSEKKLKVAKDNADGKGGNW